MFDWQLSGCRMEVSLRLMCCYIVLTTSVSALVYEPDNKDVWSECSQTCGGGFQHRLDNRTIIKFCNLLNCPEDAGCLSAYLSFEHGSYNKIFDDSQNHNNVRLLDGASIVDEGKFGKALKLTTNGSISFDVEHFRNRPMVAVTVAFWLKMSHVNGSHEIFFTCASPWNVRTGAYHIGMTQEGLVKWALTDRDDKDIFSTLSDKPLISGKWHHIAGTHKHLDGVARLYVNGKRVSESKSPPQETDIYSWECADMGNPRENKPLEGLVDEFYIFKCALLPDEISELYTKNTFKRFGIPRPQRTWQLMKDYWSYMRK